MSSVDEIIKHEHFTHHSNTKRAESVLTDERCILLNLIYLTLKFTVTSIILAYTMHAIGIILMLQSDFFFYLFGKTSTTGLE